MTTRTRLIWWCVALVTVAGLLVYLHDPSWAGAMTSGMRPWEQDGEGTPFRWTTGRGSFFVSSDASSITVPLRAIFPGPGGQPVICRISVDGRWLTDVALTEPQQWVRTTLPLPRRSSGRRFRRIDLNISRVIGPFLLGIETGVIAEDREPAPR